MEYCRQTGTVLSSLGRYLRRIKSPEQQLVRVKVKAAADTVTPPRSGIETGTGLC